jgi:hypothetical protein
MLTINQLNYPQLQPQLESGMMPETEGLDFLMALLGLTQSTTPEIPIVSDATSDTASVLSEKIDRDDPDARHEFGIPSSLLAAGRTSETNVSGIGTLSDWKSTGRGPAELSQERSAQLAREISDEDSLSSSVHAERDFRFSTESLLHLEGAVGGSEKWIRPVTSGDTGKSGNAVYPVLTEERDVRSAPAPSVESPVGTQEVAFGARGPNLVASKTQHAVSYERGLAVQHEAARDFEEAGGTRVFKKARGGL